MKKTSRRDFLKTAAAMLAAAPMGASVFSGQAAAQTRFR
jgi:anaerobic selenocysteine-containing dehydrogenase